MLALKFCNLHTVCLGTTLVKPFSILLSKKTLLHYSFLSISVILTSIASQSVSVLLYLGSKNNKSLYFVPWMTEQIIAMGIGFTKTLIMAIGGLFYHVAASHIIGFMIIFSINFLFVYSVVSHFVMLRKMKRHSKEIIQSVMTGL